VGVIGGLPVLDTVSCFANWLFQKSSFFIWEFDWVPLFQDARGIPFTGLSTRRT
jgi:hypothetical protein